MEKKQSILVIGGAGGIGQNIIEKLKKSYKIYVMDIKDEVMELWNEEDIVPIKANILDEEDIKNVSEFLKEDENFYAIIFSMGVMIPGSITEMDKSDWNNTININLNSVYTVCKHFIPILTKQKRSHIIALASCLGVVGSYGMTAYSVSKAALIELIKCIALDYGDKGLIANCISPGFVDTDMLSNAISKFATNKKWMFATGGLPKQRSDKEDISNTVELLLNQNSINGTNIVIDSAYTAR